MLHRKGKIVVDEFPTVILRVSRHLKFLGGGRHVLNGVDDRDTAITLHEAEIVKRPQEPCLGNVTEERLLGEIVLVGREIAEEDVAVADALIGPVAKCAGDVPVATAAGIARDHAAIAFHRLPDVAAVVANLVVAAVSKVCIAAGAIVEILYRKVAVEYGEILLNTKIGIHQHTLVNDSFRLKVEGTG